MFEDDRPEPDDETEHGFLNDGRPTLWTLGQAIQCWIQCHALAPSNNNKRTGFTVRDIATAFGDVSEAFGQRIIAAVDNHPWLFCQRGGFDHVMDSWVEQDGE